jgi:uncharacterized protein YdeI (YjbR/CyaY-like superfamily)
VPQELPELVVRTARQWRRWLERHGETSPGVWLVLTKRGTTEVTTLTYDEALDEALCCGWIDGQVAARDGASYRHRFTPRRPRSRWSARNAGLIARLEAEGRLSPAGAAEVARAQADGRWEKAYAGQASADIPPDLLAALDAEPRAKSAFETLSRQNRYAVIYRTNSAVRPTTRARRIETFVAMLARGETIHPQ